MSEVIGVFEGENAFLSNFFEREVEFHGLKVSTNEHGFQMMKTLNKREREDIAFAPTPGKAKRKGRKCTLRKDWEKVKKQVMLDVVRAKFEQHPDLAAKLIATGNAILIEGNTWHDNIWGNCLCPQCVDEVGQNLLGQILMQVREELKNKMAQV
jgi:ribA/ribD-fused uncharacterized protein